MKEVLKDLDKAFENRTRLGIMSALMVDDHLDFNALKRAFGCDRRQFSQPFKIIGKK